MTVQKRHPWNKGLTRETDGRVEKNSESKTGMKYKSSCKTTYDILYDLYIKKGLPMMEISKIFNVADQTLKKWLIEKNITIRNHKDSLNTPTYRSRVTGVNSSHYIDKNVTCCFCRKVFTRNKQTQHFCSNKCWTDYNSGSRHRDYDPGITDDERNCRRDIVGYKPWRTSVYKRDNHTCQKCGDNKGGNLVAHHIESYNSNPELRTTISNGITLCEDCHNDFHHQYGYGNNTKEQFIKFIG